MSQLAATKCSISASRGRLIATPAEGAYVIVRRLVLQDSSLLYPFVDGRLDVERDGSVVLARGAFAVETFISMLARRRATWVRDGTQYLVVADGAEWVSQARALECLGALEHLRRLGLDDAAVALAMGDLDAARTQWLRWRALQPQC